MQDTQEEPRTTRTNRLRLFAGSHRNPEPEREVREKLIHVLATTGTDFFTAAVDFANEWLTETSTFLYLQCPEKRLNLTVKGSSTKWSSPADKSLLRKVLGWVRSERVGNTSSDTTLHHHGSQVFCRVHEFDILPGSQCLLVSVSYNPIDIPHTFRYVRSVLDKRIVAEAKQLFTQERIKKIAFYDHLTGLPNRRLLERNLDMLIGMAGRSSKRVAVLFIDLDDFKKINDTYGHQVGDIALVDFARFLKNSCRRKSDIVGRFGGDEFVVVLSAVRTREDAAAFAQSLSQQLSSMRRDVKLQMSASIGISMFPEDGLESAALIGKADMALYDAKKSGKSRHALYQSDTCEVHQ